MELKLLPARFQDVHLMDATDIHPGDGLIGRWRKLIERQDVVLVATDTGIAEDRNRNLIRLLLADMDKGTRGEARLSGSFLD
jgi:Mor family transcriptional regulator